MSDTNTTEIHIVNMPQKEEGKRTVGLKIEGSLINLSYMIFEAMLASHELEIIILKAMEAWEAPGLQETKLKIRKDLTETIKKVKTE